MIISLYLFFKKFEGKWISQKNVYLLENRKQKTDNKITKISINPNSLFLLNKMNLFYSYNFKFLTNNIYLDYKQYNKTNLFKEFNLKLIETNLLKINCILIDKNLEYEEYLYSVSSNLKISVGILKELNYRKYIGIIMTSYIKIQ
uniref:Uncharacterized protein n=1 Tax=Bostrychia simpliciuscula TaxID=324754 RepID=A0A1Z1M7S7_9FLOR|nr:hypothetical protein [Bostrychia simpliciuscula]ARW62066.1 hypothetical protein [Bostrychia simpliciuscula]